MFASYARTQSCFQNSAMMAEAKPSVAELALLEPFRDKLPAAVFGEAWTPPVSDGSGQDRRLLRRAAELLNGAGWTVKDGKRVNAKGEPLTAEFLVFERVSEPHHALYMKNLTALGIEATVRLVDPAQYRARVQEFDFDITMERMVFSITPGDELRSLLLQQGRKHEGLVQLSGHFRSRRRCAGGAGDRRRRPQQPRGRMPRVGPGAARRALLGAWLVQALALDRLLGHVRPPGRQAALCAGIPETWWYDAEKAAKSERAG